MQKSVYSFVATLWLNASFIVGACCFHAAVDISNRVHGSEREAARDDGGLEQLCQCLTSMPSSTADAVSGTYWVEDRGRHFYDMVSRGSPRGSGGQPSERSRRGKQMDRLKHTELPALESLDELLARTRIISELDTQRPNEAPLKLPPIRMETQDHLHQRTGDFHEWLRHPKALPRRPSADEAERPPLSWHLLLLRASYNDSSLKAATVADWLAEVLDLPSEVAAKHAQAAMTRPAVHLATFPAWSEVTEKADSLRALGLAVQVGSTGLHRAIDMLTGIGDARMSSVCQPCQQWEGVMASICNADVARFEEKEMISEVLSPEYNEQQPAGFTNACARASSSQVYETQMQPVLPPSKSQESRDMPKAPARPSDEKVQEFVRQFQQVESRQASSKEALEQISTLVEVTVDMFGTLNGALNQMKTDIGHLHANLSSLETKVSQTPVPSTPPHPAAQVAEKSAGDDVVESLGKEMSLEACCGDEPMQSLQLSFTSEPTFAASTTPDSDGQSELTSLDVSKISGKSSTEGPSHPHPNEALVSLINVALKHPDLSGAPLLRQWQFQQQRVKSQRDLNVDLVANKSVLAVQNQQFAALVRVAMHHGSLAGRDLLHQFESELHFEEEKHSETRAGRSSDASISFQKQLSQDSSDEVLRSYGIQPSLCHQRGVVSLVQVALKHPDVNGFPLLQLWKKERVKIKSQRQLNLNCIEKKCEIHLQNRQFVALVYAALFYPNLEGEELLNRGCLQCGPRQRWLFTGPEQIEVPRDDVLDTVSNRRGKIGGPVPKESYMDLFTGMALASRKAQAKKRRIKRPPGSKSQDHRKVWRGISQKVVVNVLSKDPVQELFKEESGEAFEATESESQAERSQWDAATLRRRQLKKLLQRSKMVVVQEPESQPVSKTPSSRPDAMSRSASKSQIERAVRLNPHRREACQMMRFFVFGLAGLSNKRETPFGKK
eukprot:s58_g8.t2